ncbi:NAD-dependent epimerase/dehydratase family protein, partial [Bacteroidota bacterium]
MILVTGATGFIGRHVLSRLLHSNKQEEIRILLMEHEKDFLTEYPGLSYIIGDLTNERAIVEAVRGVKTIIHLASKNIDRDNTGFNAINVEGTKKLCEAAQDQKVETFIYLSSVGVYGHESHRDADESTKLAPDTDFSLSKAKAEKIVLEYNERGIFNGIVLRHRYVYGEGDVHVIPRMIKAARKYKFLLNKGKAMMSLIRVDDVAKIIHEFTKTTEREKDPVYHITDGFPIRYADIIGLFCESYDLDPPTKNLPIWFILPLLKVKELILNIDPEKTKSS